ncbi:hypothetical protein F8388_008257 [Cannabis sativa]|uniref:Protein kinase domain-containing protein n=1 Tax=Cannabis sativa TaxID=3483 RepID=A0A7J6EMX1_CANSA|nr:hypothetical protein F8388_008257 [Cannabis sativa]
MIMKKRGREEKEKNSLGKKQRSIYRRDEEWGWMRGKLLGVGGYGSVSEAIIPGEARSRPPQFKDFPSRLAVKSAHPGSSYADLIMEKNALGGSLSGLIERTKVGLLESQARVHTRSILKGLELIHHKGFVHCDIKPSNILMVHCDDNNPHGVDGLVAKIADFGLSKRSNDDFEKRVRGSTPWDVNLGQEELFSKISTETPSLPSYLTFTAQDFLLECFIRDPNQRPSAQMLLNHSFAMKWEEDSEEEDQKKRILKKKTQKKIPKRTQ